MSSRNNVLDGAADRPQAISRASLSRVVPKPIPVSQEKEPRRYQLDQMKKRHNAKQSSLQDGTTILSFHLTPSDPDFPFELDALECELQIPSAYPESPPKLRVRNRGIPRGFGVNIERGWDKMVEDKQGCTLLAYTNALDKSLEALLSEQKAETVTIVSFKDTRHVDRAANALSRPQSSSNVNAPPTPTAAPALSRPYVPEESFTNEQIASARARRAQEIRQLESRMSRLPFYQKSADGIVYTLPLEPRRRLEVPLGLRSVQSVQLIIPLLYPLQALRILLNDVESAAAEPLEELFATIAARQSQMTLMSHINYLTQNVHVMAKEAHSTRNESTPSMNSKTDESMLPKPGDANRSSHDIDGKSHIHFITRPPEWSYGRDTTGAGDTDTDSWDSDHDSDDGGVAIETEDVDKAGVAEQVERGTAISFPSAELHSIELLQVSILNISAKCERCRTMNEINGLKPNIEKTSSCKKCATPFTAKFRQEMVHSGSTRAGFIDVTACTVADMLPSTFVPTCSRCSTPSKGLVSVRGEVITNVCRECHGKFTFKLPDVRFMAISHASTLPPTTGPQRRQEKLGLHAGEPLPSRGACVHYRKSYRWFRFSCCSKVHPCDKCHDDVEEHPQEWANRMICGWCSREQNYAVEACVFCGRSVIGRKGRGFWEGGKGTRDKTKMSRKDKRKFRRVGGREVKTKE